MKNSTKIISLILSFVMVISIFNIVPFTAMAANNDHAALGATPDEACPELHINETGFFTDDGSIYYRFNAEKDMMISLDDGRDEEEPERADLYIYDSNMNQLRYGYGSVICFVESGNTYYFSAKFFCANPRFPVTLKEYQNFDWITIGETKTANIGTRAEVAYYLFVAEKDMRIEFCNDYVSATTEISIFSNYSGRYSSSMWGENQIKYYVEAGETYYLTAKFYDNERIGSFNVTLKELPLWEYDSYGNGEASIVSYNGRETDIIIPSQIDGNIITSIGSRAFSYQNQIKSIIIPDSVDSIGYSAFYDCGFKSIQIPDNVSYIPEQAFAECHLLESIKLPSGLTSIGRLAFENCYSLKEISLPNGLMAIGEEAFLSCRNISSGFIIPDTVETIEDKAYFNCRNLKEVTVGYNLLEIGDQALGYMYKDDDDLNGDFSTVKVDGFTIKGYTGSEAEVYANENGFTFVSIGQAPPKPTLSFTPKYPYEYIENYNGFWESDYDDETETAVKYFVYRSPRFYNGDKLSITYSDERGTVDYFYDDEVWAFEDKDGNQISPSDINKSNGYWWTVGGENTFTLTYKNMSTEVPVKLVKPENALIRFIPVKPFELIENREGWMEGGHFRYYTPEVRIGDQIIVDFGNETVTYTYGKKGDNPLRYSYGFFDENGQEAPYSVTTDQDHTPWTLGSNNCFILTAAGKTVLVPVTIIEYPIESIEFQLASPIVMYENQDGYYYDEDGRRLYTDENGCYYFDYSGNEPEKIYTEPAGFRYNQIPVYKDGNKLIIHNKDGSTKTLTQKFVFTEEDNGYFFIDEEGNYDRNVSFDWGNQEETPFKLGDDNIITVKYLDNTTTIPVSVIQNNIESIEYQPVSPIVYNINDPKDVYTGAGYGATTGRLYNPQKMHETGSVLTAHFKDGTTKKYSMYSISNISDGKFNPVIGARYYAIDEEGSVIGYSSLMFNYDTSDWSAGNIYYLTVGYLGKTTRVPVKVIDGNDETYILGDADGNGEIESVDATFVQRYVASIPTPYSDSQLMHGDVDGDGNLTVMDATAIQYYLCHLKTDYAIGKAVS